MVSRPFVVLYLSVFVATMGISMVSPLLPVYAERLGATGIWIGLTFSIFAVTQTLVSPFVGGWSDRLGRKPFIIGGLLLYFVAAGGYLAADTFVLVLAFRALSGAGTSMIFSVARAYVGDMMPAGQEGRWSGIFATADIVGFGVGPLLAGLVREFLGFEAVFVGMALLMAASAALVAVLLPPAPPEERAGDEPRRPPAAPLGVALRDTMVVALALNHALIALSWGSTLSFLGVRLERLEVSAALIGFVFSVESIASGLVQPVLGALADRVSRRGLAVAGLLVLAGLLASLGLTERVAVVALLMAGAGAAAATAMVATTAMQVDAGRRVGMGAVLGIGSTGNGLGVVFGSVAGGFVVDLTDTSTAAFFFAGGSMALGALVFLWMSGRASARRPVLARVAAERDGAREEVAGPGARRS